MIFIAEFVVISTCIIAITAPALILLAIAIDSFFDIF